MLRITELCDEVSFRSTCVDDVDEGDDDDDGTSPFCIRPADVARHARVSRSQLVSLDTYDVDRWLSTSIDDVVLFICDVGFFSACC